MDAEYLNLYILQNSIGLGVCGLLGDGCLYIAGSAVSYAAKKDTHPDNAGPAMIAAFWSGILGLIFLGAAVTCAYDVAKASIAPQTVLAERVAK